MTDTDPTDDIIHPHIGTLKEFSLHAALKQHLMQPGDLTEVKREGYVIDVVRPAEHIEYLIEVQTGNFSSMKKKLRTLLATHPVQLVHPIALRKDICRLASDGVSIASRRKSPKRGSVYHLFDELVYIPTLALNSRLTITVLLTHEEEIRRNDGKGSWRRKGWSIYDRRLVNVEEGYAFGNADDFLRLLPDDLHNSFTTRELSEAIGERMRLAQKMAFTLHKMGLLERVGKRGRSYLYQVT